MSEYAMLHGLSEDDVASARQRLCWAFLAWSALDWLHEARFDPGQEHPIFDWCGVPHYTAAIQFDAPRAGAVFKRGRQGQGFYRDARSAAISVSSPESLDRFLPLVCLVSLFWGRGWCW